MTPAERKRRAKNCALLINAFAERETVKLADAMSGEIARLAIEQNIGAGEIMLAIKEQNNGEAMARARVFRSALLKAANG